MLDFVWAVHVAGLLTLASGIIAGWSMQETLRTSSHGPAGDDPLPDRDGEI